MHRERNCKGSLDTPRQGGIAESFGGAEEGQHIPRRDSITYTACLMVPLNIMVRLKKQQTA
jgi:hypothetical protein